MALATDIVTIGNISNAMTLSIHSAWNLVYYHVPTHNLTAPQVYVSIIIIYLHNELVANIVFDP